MFPHQPLVQASPSKSLLAVRSWENMVLAGVCPVPFVTVEAQAAGLAASALPGGSGLGPLPAPPRPHLFHPRLHPLPTCRGPGGFLFRADLWVPPSPARRQEGLTEETGHRHLTASEGEADSRGPPGKLRSRPSFRTRAGGAHLGGAALSNVALSGPLGCVCVPRGFFLFNSP